MQKGSHSRNVNKIKAQVLIFSIFVGLGFLLDRTLKYFAEQKLPDEELFIIPRFLSLYLHHNQGMAFGINVPMALIIVVGIIIIMALGFSIIYAVRLRRLDWYYPLFLIFCGGTSNLIDRIGYGYTIDYFYMRPYSFFNIADLMIIAGCLISLASSWFKKRHYG